MRSTNRRPVYAVPCCWKPPLEQGTCLGWRFEQLAAILNRARQPDRLGVCFDTCHVFAAGHALNGKKKYEATIAEFDRLIGIRQIRAIPI